MQEIEKIVWQRIQQKDAEAFESYYKENYKCYFLMAYKYLGSEVAAEEVVNDVFVKIWEDGSTITIESSLKSYMYRAVINRSINILNRQKKEKLNKREYLHDASDSYLMRHIEENEMKLRLYAAIDQLPDQCAKIFRMSRFDGLKHAEIAEKLDISIKTVKNNVTIALKELSKALDKVLVMILFLIKEFFSGGL